MQATKKRKLKSGEAFEHLFGKPTGQIRIVKKNASLGDTIRLIKKVVKNYSYQARKIAPQLIGESLKETCKNIWDFIYEHIQYELDEEGKEQIHHVWKIWEKRKIGVDCDDYTVFASSILTELSIPHKLRVAKYWDQWGFKKQKFQHIYVIVPTLSDGSDGDYITIDPVKDQFNREHPFAEKKDIKMPMELEELSGINEDGWQLVHPDSSSWESDGSDSEHIDRIHDLDITSEDIAKMNHWLRKKTGKPTSNLPTRVDAGTIARLRELELLGREYELIQSIREGESLGNPFGVNTLLSMGASLREATNNEEVREDIKKTNLLAQKDYTRINRLGQADFMRIQQYLAIKILGYEVEESATSRTIEGLRATKWLGREQELLDYLQKPEWKKFLEKNGLYIGLGIGTLGLIVGIAVASSSSGSSSSGNSKK